MAGLDGITVIIWSRLCFLGTGMTCERSYSWLWQNLSQTFLSGVLCMMPAFTWNLEASVKASEFHWNKRPTDLKELHLPNRVCFPSSKEIINLTRDLESEPFCCVTWECQNIWCWSVNKNQRAVSCLSHRVDNNVKKVHTSRSEKCDQ